LNEYLVRVIQFLLSLLSVFIPVHMNRVGFIRRSFSGSNITPVVDWLHEHHPEVDILLLDSSPSGRLVGSGNWLYRLKQYLALLQCRVIVTSHGPFVKTHRNVTIELWHAFPTKKESALFNRRARQRIKRINRMTDQFISYSDFASLLYNSRYHMALSKYISLGAPRNDYLLTSIPDLYHAEFKKVILYAPTFRESFDKTKPLKMDFWLTDFRAMEFHKFLVEHGYLLIWKLHPNEEKRWAAFDQNEFPTKLLVLTDQKLRDMGIDFYQLLSLTDALVTDYSSIYADYLLLDRPMVFVPADEDFFNEQRGLLLNPYDVWMPGPKCRNQQQLQDEISHSLEDSAYFQHERQFLRGVFHRFTDGKSTERVANFILSKLEN
jgi:CDP-glycerol glycerophosphotransferase (TagB/SpsB family)